MKDRDGGGVRIIQEIENPRKSLQCNNCSFQKKLERWWGELCECQDNVNIYIKLKRHISAALSTTVLSIKILKL